MPVSSDFIGRPRIVALGDSLTSGHGIGTALAFPSILQQQLDARGYVFTIVNAGVSGDTTADALARLAPALRGDVRVLIVALGANDGLRGMPVPAVRLNLARIIEGAQARGVRVLLCGMEAPPVYGWDYSRAFHAAFEELARTFSVPLVPFMLMTVLGSPALMQTDRLHPNAEGARIIANHVWPHLESLLAASGYSRGSAT